MMSTPDHPQVQEAWRQARRKAFWGKVRAHLQGKSTTILNFDEVAQRFQLTTALDRGVQTIPLHKIVGSVGRYHDFVDAFLPNTQAMQGRWQGVASLALNPNRTMPAIEVFQVGDAYFVRDGNHRVSVANQLRLTEIKAHVCEFTEPVFGLVDHRNLDAALAETERQAFLIQTKLGPLLEDDLRLTASGGYDIILGQILYYQHILSQIDGDEKSFAAAAAAWYDFLYLTTVQIIADSGIMADFPQRTPADLFVWLTQHQHQLEADNGKPVLMKEAAGDLSKRHRPGLPIRLWQRLRTMWKRTGMEVKPQKH